MCLVTITLPTEVVVAIRGDLFFRHDQAAGRLEVSGVLSATNDFEVGVKFDFDLWEVILVEGATLGTEAEAIVFHFEEGDGVALPGERFVEDEDGGLDAGVGIKTARWEGDDGDEGVFDKHLAEVFVSALALEDDALGNDDTGTASGRKVLGHVVH